MLPIKETGAGSRIIGDVTGSGEFFEFFGPVDLQPFQSGKIQPGIFIKKQPFGCRFGYLVHISGILRAGPRLASEKLAFCVCEVHIIPQAVSATNQAWAIHMRMKKTSQRKQRNIVGKRIRQARLKCVPPVSQDDLAGRLAAVGIVVDQTAISRMENQSRYLMDYEVAAVARCLKVSVAWLYGEAG